MCEVKAPLMGRQQGTHREGGPKGGNNAEKKKNAGHEHRGQQRGDDKPGTRFVKFTKNQMLQIKWG